MKLLLKRIALRDTYTIGKIYIDGEYFCDTLEDKVRDLNKNGVFDGDEKKVYGETAIPYGTYKVILSYSPKFNRIFPELLDVPCFTGIRIHRGNTEKDTAGCLLVGENKVRGKVLNSTYWEKKLIEKLEGKNGITIQIV